MKKQLATPLADTLKNLQEALVEWNSIPEDAESEMDAFCKKTRELVQKLNEQIKALEL